MTYRLAELSAESGVPVATIKFYLREGLLPPGRPVSARRSDYSEEHFRRLRLIRALIGVRGLSVDETRDVLGAVDAHPGDPHLALGLAVGAVRPDDLGDDDPGAHDDSGTAGGSAAPDDSTAPGDSAAAGLVADLGWEVHPRTTALSRLDSIIHTFAELYPDEDLAATFLPYARLMEQVAVIDLGTVDRVRSSGRGIERAVIGTFLLDEALRELRRLAQEDASSRRER